MQRLNSKGCYISFLFALSSLLCAQSGLALRSAQAFFDILIQTKNEIAISGRKKRPLTKLILIYTCFSIK